MKLRTLKTFAFSLALGSVTAAWGQSREVPAPPQVRPVVIHSATIHTVADGIIEGTPVQIDVLEVLAGVLRPGGALILGSHECLPAEAETFEPWRPGERIYRRRLETFTDRS